MKTKAIDTSNAVLTESGAPVPPDFALASYTYDLPEEQIAQHPADKRGASRLFVVNRATGTNTHAMFSDLADFLPKNALLVVNNSKVLPARIFGTRPSGGRVEFLMLTPLPLIVASAAPEKGEGWQTAEVEGLLRMSKRVKPGGEVTFSDDFHLVVAETGEFGKCFVRLFWRGELKQHFLSQGHLPLPPYIKREDDSADKDRYQTVYAKDEQLGSVAAPTAGLHFTDELRTRLAERGFTWAEVTLYVGYGTFSPVRCADIRDHGMHKEFIEITPEAAEAIAKAKAEGRPIVTVGTTSTRVLEGAFAQTGKIAPFRGWTDIFIYPGFAFKVADHVITNFHLPESSLLMMIGAFAGRERVLEAYAEALSKGFRVFSYGDSMLLL
ncbi:tRNA preQ1(34) S-adenosylmethionine ribosyltransferase-isomerase QueA [Desulfovibrio mangrovi]|uniref:tRNA preQ1(34) S-adenosylmethionine ribosyltransferase-isomerase QueA n=1 Tax=Desulfovibrio mangrovi TaxID=2976983 RepID=UPI002246AEBE|nr:tRNA preQ1(34) S-adenosylmethionine ribosyltransferase-isomerase QueA [Desulfovibrio mangrovi]UZP66381.1 tRNA preQ1(34) S-adenosylmethionine ribosyltransferase-isomerase QueA [Desulfovibrio mangrovi]